MALDIFCNGQPLRLTYASDVNVDYLWLKGVAVQEGKGEFGRLLIQQIETPLVSITQLWISWEQPASIVCKHQFDEPVLFMRTNLADPAVEVFKGAGIQRYRPKQYAYSFGVRWQSLFMPEKPGVYLFFDVAYKKSFFTSPHSKQKAIRTRLATVNDKIPGRVTGSVFMADAEMYKTLFVLRSGDYTSPETKEQLRSQADQLLQSALSQAENAARRRGVSQRHHEVIEQVKALLADPVTSSLTIPELGRRAGIGSGKLKRLFPEMTGHTVDEYRRYLQLKPIADRIAATDLPIKSIYLEAGYGAFPAFSVGFKKALYCLPSEIRKDDWAVGDV